MTFSRGCAGRQRTHADLGVTLKKDVIACMPVKSVGFGFGPGFARFRGGSPSTSLEDQEGGAGVARAWRGRGVGNRHLLAWGGADMARALPVPLGSVLHPLYCEWEAQWQTVASAAIATNHYSHRGGGVSRQMCGANEPREIPQRLPEETPPPRGPLCGPLPDPCRAVHGISLDPIEKTIQMKDGGALMVHTHTYDQVHG
eukprot:gene22131-biopygen2706